MRRGRGRRSRSGAVAPLLAHLLAGAGASLLAAARTAGASPAVDAPALGPAVLPPSLLRGPGHAWNLLDRGLVPVGWRRRQPADWFGLRQTRWGQRLVDSSIPPKPGARPPGARRVRGRRVDGECNRLHPRAHREPSRRRSNRVRAVATRVDSGRSGPPGARGVCDDHLRAEHVQRSARRLRRGTGSPRPGARLWRIGAASRRDVGVPHRQHVRGRWPSRRSGPSGSRSPCW